MTAFFVTFLLGRHGAEISGRTVMVLVAAEFLLLIIMNVLIVGAQGVAAFPLESFTPTAIFSRQPGLALMTGLTSLIGIEAGILYSRETKNARRAIPRAIYGAIAGVPLLYVVPCWIIVGGLGVDTAVAAAVELQGDVVFGLAFQFGGYALLVPMQIFFVGSVLASSITMHNAASRYMADLASNGNPHDEPQLVCLVTSSRCPGLRRRLTPTYFAERSCVVGGYAILGKARRPSAPRATRI